MGLRFLIVDDSELNLGITQIILKGRDIASDRASNAEDAYKLILNNNYDVVLLDYLMPGTNGVEAAAHIRKMTGGIHPDEYYKSLPLVALTAEDDTEQQKLLLKTDFNDLVVKPFNSASLDTVVEKWCNLDPNHLRIHGIEQTTYQGMLSADRDGFFEIASMFSSDIPAKHLRITEALKNHDYQSYTVEVHRIKSEAKIIGATAIAQAAAMLEAVGKALTGVSDNGRSHEDNVKYITIRVPKLLRELDMTNSDLMVAINRHNLSKSSKKKQEAAVRAAAEGHTFTDKEHSKLLRYISHAEESLEKAEYDLVKEWLSELKELINKK